MEKELNLPQTDFPQKANSKEREPQFNKFWEDNDVFSERSKMNSKKEFVLHDGPPYANGSPHMGHYLNKTLKDVVNKYKLMSGYKVRFVPGWDCHGLPTELAVQKKYGNLPAGELREKCMEFALEQMDVQRQFFKKLGLTGEWDNPYLTMSKEYETHQLKALGELLLSGKVYRDERPVHYSPSTRTVLAEAELEYLDRKDTSAYFKMPSKDFSLLVWTTMPWTLFGNRAVCVNPKMQYVVVEHNGENLLLAESRLSLLENYSVKQKMLGEELEGLEYENPLNGESWKVVVDKFVSDDSGTGLVHLCPAHGDEDFKVCSRYGLAPKVLTNQKGCFLDNDMNVLEEGAAWTLEQMRDKGMLFKTEELVHSYPHDWRTGKPVLYMLTKQFFLNLGDKDNLMKEVKNVDFSNGKYKNRFSKMLLDRNNWCFSRQRKWGFPLTVFLNEKDEVVFDKEMLEHLESLFSKFGSNSWFTLSLDELLPEGHRGKGLKKCEDTVDVWLDSGLSWNSVLENKEADLYFEGLDQHRGWFQSSFLTSMMLQGKSPYKKVLTHGFVLDSEGRKMSKSLGNVVDPNKYLNLYNADVLRLWALSVDYTQDVRVGDDSVESMSRVYFKLRNNFRYMLSNLFDYDKGFQPGELGEKDKKALKSLADYKRKMLEAYESYDFRSLFNLTVNFVSKTSSEYFDLETKGLLYEGSADRLERRNRQYVFSVMLKEMVVLMAPMTPYLCEDVWNYMNEEKKSVFFEDFLKNS
ncbi:MAG: isoleucine--tRNA ligase [Nanoarchaeota archaeon]